MSENQVNEPEKTTPSETVPPVENTNPQIEAEPPEPAPIKEKKAKKKDKNKEAALPPIIKKTKKHGHGHHGGAWKIAYADFVTAMMAFFLLMWLVASLNKAQKDGISDYFRQPIKVSLMGGQNMGERQISVQGGGTSLKDADGQVAATNDPLEDKQIKTQKDTTDSSKNEKKSLENLKSEINISIDKDPALAGLKKQLIMEVTKDGLLIQLVDNQNKPMFDVGSDKISPQIQPILDNIAKVINSVPNKVSIEGHTDANEYHNPQELDYTNWELSTQRANAARRALVKAGMKEERVMKVTGYSSTVLMDKNNPLNPENRRISIIVMNKSLEEKTN